MQNQKNKDFVNIQIQKIKKQRVEMNRSLNQNYDTKSSLFSIDYKIPYEVSYCQGSKIVQHLEESQQQLQFLKLKLTEAYQKLQRQININMELSDNNQELMNKVQSLQLSWEAEIRENKKLKEVMETVIQNRKLVQEEVQYTHKRYKKMLQDKDEEYAIKLEQLERAIKRLKKENQTLEQSLQQRSKKDNFSSSKISCDKQRKLEHKIQILETEIKKLTTEKVTEVSRLKHQIECYQRSSLSPIRTPLAEHKPPTTRPPKIEYFDIESNNFSQNDENTNININTMHNSTVVQSKVTIESKATDDDSISKWQKNKNSKVSKNGQMTDDQKLTRAQMQKKKIENQLMKLERLKRHAPEDRQVMDELEKKIYEIDSEISSLKRKIRQRY